MVIYTHAYYLGGFGEEPLFSHHGRLLGTEAVHAFFVLSGLLITHSYISTQSPGRFLWHRFLRIAPALWGCLALTAFVLAPMMLEAVDRSGSVFTLEPSAIEYVWRNLLRPRTQIAIGDLPVGVPKGGDWNGSLWTLSYEIFCYGLVCGLGVIGLLTRWRRVGLAILLAAIAAYSLWKMLPPTIIPAIVARLYDTPGKQAAVFFYVGAALALLPQLRHRLTASAFVGPLALALYVAGVHLRMDWIAPWLLAAVVVWLAGLPVAHHFERKVGGDYSYGLYIYAYPVQQMLAFYEAPRLGLMTYALLGACITLLIAISSWHLIERPALSLKGTRFPWSLRRAQSSPQTRDSAYSRDQGDAAQIHVAGNQTRG